MGGRAGCLWAKAGSRLWSADEFENMSDEELRQYIYGSKELDS